MIQDTKFTKRDNLTESKEWIIDPKTGTRWLKHEWIQRKKLEYSHRQVNHLFYILIVFANVFLTNTYLIIYFNITYRKIKRINQLNTKKNKNEYCKIN